MFKAFNNSKVKLGLQCWVQISFLLLSMSACQTESGQGGRQAPTEPPPDPARPDPEDPETLVTFYADCDLDTFAAAGAATQRVLGGTMPEPTAFCLGWTDIPPEGIDVDCNDADPQISPEGRELCDDVDNDCDGENNEGLSTPYFLDCDRDGFAERGALMTMGCRAKGDALIVDSDISVLACGTGTLGWTEVNPAFESDCNDANRSRNPNQIELCDEIDNDCDGKIDEHRKRRWLDCDGDGFGEEGAHSELVCLRGASESPSPQNFRAQCPNPETADPQWTTNPPYVIDFENPDGDRNVTNNIDCDDANSEVRPDVEELCGDEIDNNCNGEVDEILRGERQFLYLDCDADGVSERAGVFTRDYPGDVFRAEACENAAGVLVTGVSAREQCPRNSPNARWIEALPGPDGDCDGTDPTKQTLNFVPKYLDCDGDGAIRSDCLYCNRCMECHECQNELETCLEGDSPDDCQACAEECEDEVEGPCEFCESYRSAVLGDTEERFFNEFECEINGDFSELVCGTIDLSPQPRLQARNACRSYCGDDCDAQFENAQFIPFLPPHGRAPCDPNNPRDNEDDCFELPVTDCNDADEDISEWTVSRLIADCDGDGLLSPRERIIQTESGRHCFTPTWNDWVAFNGRTNRGQRDVFPGVHPPPPDQTAEVACYAYRESNAGYSEDGYASDENAVWQYVPEAIDDAVLGADCNDFDHRATSGCAGDACFRTEAFEDLALQGQDGETSHDYNCDGENELPDGRSYSDDTALYMNPDVREICVRVARNRCQINPEAFCVRESCGGIQPCCGDENAFCDYPVFPPPNAENPRNDADHEDPNRLTPSAWFWFELNEQNYRLDSPECNLRVPGCGETRLQFKECILTNECTTCNNCAHCFSCNTSCLFGNDQNGKCDCENPCPFEGGSDAACDGCTFYQEALRNDAVTDFVNNFKCLREPGDESSCSGLVVEEITVPCR